MIEYEEDSILDFMLVPFKLKGSVAVRASKFALPAALLVFAMLYMDSITPGLLDQLHINEVSLTQVSVLWGATTGILVLLLSFRTNRAMARFWEGTGLLHQMRGEWFDSVSCCVTFSRAAVKDRPMEVRDFRHTIVRLMSLCHGSALQEISGCEDEDFETIDTLGLSDSTLRHLKDCRQNHDFNRVEVLLHLIQSLIAKSLDDGVIKVAPPILSRVYQTLSRGFVNLLNAKKIADTRFPFPYAQTIAMLLFINMFLTPLLMIRSINSQVWAPIFCFVPLFGMFSLNFIGAQLENPFGADDNDLPLDHFQAEMNKCLMMLLQDNADLLPGISKKRCVLDYDTLRGMVFEGTEPKRVRVSKFDDYETTTNGAAAIIDGRTGSVLLSGVFHKCTAAALAARGSTAVPQMHRCGDAPAPRVRASRVSTFEQFTWDRPELGDMDAISEGSGSRADLAALAIGAAQSAQSERPPGSPLVGPLVDPVGGITAPVPILSKPILELHRTRLQEDGEPESLKESPRRLEVVLEEASSQSLGNSAEALRDVVLASPSGGGAYVGTPKPEPKPRPEPAPRPDSCASEGAASNGGPESLEQL